MSADLVGILPELILTVGGLLLLILPMGPRKGGSSPARLLGMITLSFLVAALDAKLLLAFKQKTLFEGMLIHDTFSIFLHLAILVSVALIVASILGYAKEEIRSRKETYALILLTTVGLLVLVSAQNLALIYVALELVSLLSYLMTGLLKKESLSVEAALKYFLFGSVATGALLYGVSLLYGLTGVMDLSSLSALFPQAAESSPVLAKAALFLVLIGFGFKVALVPFHMWAPDAYEGAPTPVAAFLSVGPKLAGFGVLIRVLTLGFSPQVVPWPTLLVVLSIFTMTLGNVVAVVQTNVKRLLAYSSIAHAGTMLIGLAVATPLGLTATLYYLAAYLLMNIGAFAGVIAVANASGREDLSSFSGLSQRCPGLAFMITVSLLSLAGIPPMAGFFAKLWIFAAALEAEVYTLAIVAAVNSVVALFYYAKIIKTMYLDPMPTGASVIPSSRWLQLTLGATTVGLFLLGLLPTGGWNFASQASFLHLPGADFSRISLHLKGT